MKFLCKKRDGKSVIEKDFNGYTSKLKDGLYTIELNEIKRSSQQNRFYWLYLRIISEETGDNENDLHEYFKRKFLPPRFANVLGNEIKLPASTTKLNKKDFGEYIEKISILTGVPIPYAET